MNITTSHRLVLTKAQRRALKQVFERNSDEAKSYKEFRKRVKGTFGMDGAIVIPWRGMFLAIETEGYTHS
jgi:hypothetical protein